VAGGDYSPVRDSTRNTNGPVGAELLGSLIDQHAAALDRPAVLVPPPGETLDGKEVAAAVDSLCDEEREVVVARLWGELSFREIGEVTGTSERTAHRRYRSALVRLREKVNPSCANPKENTS